MDNIVLNISVNRRTKQLIGYWKPENDSVGIIVEGYAVDDLQNKFEAAKKEYLEYQDFLGEKTAKVLRDTE